MHTTLDIDDDVLQALIALARRQDKSVGDVLSALARDYLITTPLEHTPAGLPVQPRRPNAQPEPEITYDNVRPSKVLELRRDAIKEVLSHSKVKNARVFGSTLHGTDMEGSDLDLLVDAPPGTTILDLSQLQLDLEDLLGIKVDLRTPDDLSPQFRAQVLAQAVAL